MARIGNFFRAAIGLEAAGLAYQVRRVGLTVLKKLVDDGVLRVEADGASPSRRRYALTDSGQQLAIVITALWQWGEQHCFGPGESAPLLLDKTSGQPLAPLELKTAKGRIVNLRHLQMALKARG